MFGTRYTQTLAIFEVKRSEEEQNDVEGQEDVPPAYENLFPKEDATHPYLYKMLQNV